MPNINPSESNTKKTSSFPETVLGTWSSHPKMLRKQIVVFACASLIPLAALIYLIVKLFQNKALDITNISQVLLSMKALLMTGCAIAGFVSVLILLNLAARKMNAMGGVNDDRDVLVGSEWVTLVIGLFWVGIWGLHQVPSVRENLRLQLILDLMCILPCVFLIAWLLWGVKKEKEEGKKCIFFLLASILSFGGGAYMLTPAKSLPEWLRSDLVRLPILFGSLFLGCIFLILYFTVLVKKTQKKKKKKTEETEPPDYAQYILEHLPEDVAVVCQPFEVKKKDGESEFVSFLKMRQTCFTKHYSPCEPSEDEDFFLYRCLMGGKVPTNTQVAFLKRFREAYEDVPKLFFENLDPKKSLFRSDIILQGNEGSGKTEVLLAAALYAAIARGQRVLFLVKDTDYAQRLAALVNERLTGLLLDCYYSSDVLNKLNVEQWLTTRSAVQNSLAEDSQQDQKSLPADILFSTPEAVDRLLFCNGMLNDHERKKLIQQLIQSFNVVIVDDLTELPLTRRAHLAFILDKIRLLLAEELSLCQFVVGTGLVYEPYGVEKLGERLFGLHEFNRQSNVITLHPRESMPFWFCRLKVRNDGTTEKGIDLNALALDLAKIGLATGSDTLVFYRGIGKDAALKLQVETKSSIVPLKEIVLAKNSEQMAIDDIQKSHAKNAKKTDIKVGELYVCQDCHEIEDIDVEKHPVQLLFYVSKTGDVPTSAIRSFLNDNPEVIPVFFSISLEEDADIDRLKIEKEGGVLVNAKGKGEAGDDSQEETPSTQEETPQEIVDELNMKLRQMVIDEHRQIVLMPDETALALRAWHLRTLLPFIQKESPVEANVWSHFGINKSHPCMREISEDTSVSMYNPIQWLYDDLSDDSEQGSDLNRRYPENVIWPYLVLRNVSTISGQDLTINYDIFPNNQENIGLVRHPESLCGDSLVMGIAKQQDDEGKATSLALWKDGRGVALWESDISHADEFVFKDMANSGEEYVVSELRRSDQSEDATYAFTVRAKYSNILYPDKVIPVKKISWTIPKENLKIGVGTNIPELRSFSFDFGERNFCRITGIINGFVDKIKGAEAKCLACSYSYDAYLSINVLHPVFDNNLLSTHGDDDAITTQVKNSLMGAWNDFTDLQKQDENRNFSPMLTHALSAVLQHRMLGWNFYTLALAFYTKNQPNSIGDMVVWFIEPFNSGQTGGSMLNELMRSDEEFRGKLVYRVMEMVKSFKSVRDMRRASGLAFINDHFNPDERKRVLEVLERMGPISDSDSDDYVPEKIAFKQKTEDDASRPQDTNNSNQTPDFALDEESLDEENLPEGSGIPLNELFKDFPEDKDATDEIFREVDPSSQTT